MLVNPRRFIPVISVYVSWSIGIIFILVISLNFQLEILRSALAESIDSCEIAQQGLPQSSQTVGPLRRGPNGEVEVVDPTKESGGGSGRCSADTICVGPAQTYRTLSQALTVARA